jgi:hypothetical protein
MAYVGPSSSVPNFKGSEMLGKAVKESLDVGHTFGRDKYMLREKELLHILPSSSLSPFYNKN